MAGKSDSISSGIPLYQVDSFTNKAYSGNPAAVCHLEAWLPDETLLNVAAENNLSETAFFVREGDDYHLRWFTPVAEVALCGHATLAAAFVIFTFVNPELDEIGFTGLSGKLVVRRNRDGMTMDFPVWPCKEEPVPDALSRALGSAPSSLYKGTDWVAVYDDPEIVRSLEPDMIALSNFKDARGIVVTAPGSGGTDFVSRAFFPGIGIAEDPVTGSTHCLLAPIWARKLGKTLMIAEQLSKRGGRLICELKNGRLEITGQAVLYMQGTIRA